MTENVETHHSKLNDNNQPIEMLAEIFKEQLRLLGRLLVALRSVRPAHKQPHAPDLTLDIAEMKPRVAYERDEELATD